MVSHQPQNLPVLGTQLFIINFFSFLMVFSIQILSEEEENKTWGRSTVLHITRFMSHCSKSVMSILKLLWSLDYSEISFPEGRQMHWLTPTLSWLHDQGGACICLSVKINKTYFDGPQNHGWSLHLFICYNKQSIFWWVTESQSLWSLNQCNWKYLLAQEKRKCNLTISGVSRKKEHYSIFSLLSQLHILFS